MEFWLLPTAELPRITSEAVMNFKYRRNLDDKWVKRMLKTCAETQQNDEISRNADRWQEIALFYLRFRTA